MGWIKTILALISIMMSWSIVRLVHQWASAHMLDVPNERSSHTKPTPKGGGLAIVLTSISLLIFTILTIVPSAMTVSMQIYIVVALLIAGVGWIDDRRNVNTRLRLVLQILAVLGILITMGGEFHRINVPLIGGIEAAWLLFLLNMMWLVGFINAFNFMDGIDGIAGVQAVTASAGWFFISRNVDVINILSLLICFSSLGFLIMNWHPAKIFLGDVGSTFLGLTLGVLPLLVHSITDNPNTFITGVILVAPFVFDSSLTLARRLLNRENILKPHRSHLYQRLVRAGLSHSFVASVYGLFCVICMVLAILYYYGGTNVQMFSLIGVLSMCAMLTLFTFSIERRNLLHSD